MGEMSGLIAGLIAAIPMLVVPILWKNRKLSRFRAALEAFGAIAASVLLLMGLGALLVPEMSGTLSYIPMLISGGILVVSLNRKVNSASQTSE